jgi:hypothetical protein
MMFGKQKNGSRRLSKEAGASVPRRSRGARKARATARAQDFLRALSAIGLSSQTPVLRRFHD